MAYGDSWTTEQKIVEGYMIMVTVIDYGQTVDIASKGEELNPMLGSNPSKETVKAYFIKSSLAHFIVASMLPSKWRTRFLYTTSGYQTAFILHNHWIGYRVEF